MGYRDNKRSLRQKMQDIMSTPKGQTVMNYAYNWGASIVIMGTLFKLVHLPGANTMLCVGMGTEVLIFFISAFDLSGVKRQMSQESGVIVVGSNTAVNAEQNTPLSAGAGTSFADAGSMVSGGNMLSSGNLSGGNMIVGGTNANVGNAPIGMPPSIPSPVISSEMEEATTAYLEQLKSMTEILSRCTTQAQTLSQDTDQMNTLNRNLSGINAIYELQLRSVSTQIGTIDQVHEQTRRMARQIEELNEVYARMLQAMTVK